MLTCERIVLAGVLELASGRANNCPECYAASDPNARFCSSCGARLTKVQTSETPGEHRQITVMFCDLVGSTDLSRKLEPEDLQLLLRRYQTICAGAIEARGGMIAQYLGDGILAYFGYPKAAENAAERGIAAALAIVREIREEDARKSYGPEIESATRIALHTGRVLVGEMGAGSTRDQHAITGVVPNLAARLEQCAPKNGVVVSPETMSLAVRNFAFRSLGPQELKGFADPVDVFQVLGPRARMSVLPEHNIPLLGRETELAALHTCWSNVEAGHPARMAIFSAPGVGKSSLTSGFIDDLELPARQIIEISGSNTSRNTPFISLRETIKRWLTALRNDDGISDEAIIAEWFRLPNIAASADAQFLLSFIRDDITVDAETRPALTAACAALIAALPKPLALVVEDAHWVDHSTLELLDGIARDRAGVLLLLLARPDHGVESFVKEAQTIRLTPLDEGACGRLAASVAGAPLEKRIVKRISEISDGVPLFVVELTKAQIASGIIVLSRGVYRETDNPAVTDTPTSLLDLITERLDGLGRGKVLAQVAAVIGRRFDTSALSILLDEDIATVGIQLDRLVEDGIVTREWSGQFVFAHALYQKAAYETLVRSIRKDLHARYVDWLHEKPARLETLPAEALGFHLVACYRYDLALEQYLAAGLTAKVASASHEAVSQFAKCRDLLDRAAPDDGILRLHIQVFLADALLSARGSGAPETRAAYRLAVEMADGLPESEWHFAAYWGWWRVSEDFAVMAERGQRLLQISDRMQGEMFKLQARHCAWANAFQTGQIGSTLDYARTGLTLYESGSFTKTEMLYGGHDCKVCAHGSIALASWLNGAGDAAVADVEAALTSAERLDHAGSILHALDIAVMLHYYRGDTKACRSLAQRLHDLADIHDLSEYRAKGEIFAGWVDTCEGKLRDGLARLEAGFAIMREVGTPEDFPVYNGMRATALAALGETDAAFAALSDARAVMAEVGVSYWSAEITRLEVETMIRASSHDAVAIAKQINAATKIAREQDARALELRIAITAHQYTGGAETAATLRRVLDALGPDHTSRDAVVARDLLNMMEIAE